MFEAQSGDATVALPIAFAATVLGVLVGAVYRALLRLRATGVEKIDDIPRFLGGVLRSVDLWLGLFAAPIVFALILKSGLGMELSASVIVALENGFCAQVLIQGLLGNKGEDVVSVGPRVPG